MPDVLYLNGRSYPLDRLPEQPRFGALPRFRDAYLTDSATLHEIDQLTTFAPPVLDQVQNGCVGHGGSTAFTICWLQAGLPLPPGGFSPTFLYACLNGGHDQGAMIGDLVAAVKETGLCSAGLFPEDAWSPRDSRFAAARAAAAACQIDEAYAAADYDELIAGLSRGFSAARSLMVGRSYMNLDRNGVVGVDRGPGNHCECSAALRKLGGQWQTGEQNSWGLTFGAQGRAWSGADHWNCQGYPSAVLFKSVKRPAGTDAPDFQI